jgi:hypothetical protein
VANDQESVTLAALVSVRPTDRARMVARSMSGWETLGIAVVGGAAGSLITAASSVVVLRTQHQHEREQLRRQRMTDAAVRFSASAALSVEMFTWSAAAWQAGADPKLVEAVQGSWDIISALPRLHLELGSNQVSPAARMAWRVQRVDSRTLTRLQYALALDPNSPAGADAMRRFDLGRIVLARRRWQFVELARAEIDGAGR